MLTWFVGDDDIKGGSHVVEFFFSIFFFFFWLGGGFCVVCSWRCGCVEWTKGRKDSKIDKNQFDRWRVATTTPSWRSRKAK